MKKTFKHNKFTGTFSNDGGYISFTGHIDGSSGAVSTQIAAIDSRFKLFDALHLSSASTGEPMHFIDNASHFIKEGKRDALVRHIRNEAIADKLLAGETFTKEMIETLLDQYREELHELMRLVETIPEDLREDSDELTAEDFSNPDQAQALRDHLDCPFDAIDECKYDSNVLSAEGGEYLVVEDDEADRIWDEYMENYIEECVLDQLPDNLRGYFDNEAFKRDAAHDGRGHTLASYDGHENFEGDFYIYRTN